MREVEINFRLTKKDYINAMFSLKRNKLIIRLFILGSLLLFTIAALSIFLRPDKPLPIQDILVGICISIFYPFVIYLQANKLFNTNKRLEEEMKYLFAGDRFFVTGESFKSEMSWDKVYKIEDSKKYIFLYQSKLEANIISKSAFSEEQLNDFKQIISRYKLLLK